MRAILLSAILLLPASAMAQGNDFPTFPNLPPFSPPPLIVPDADPALPSLVSQERKTAAAQAADSYDGYAQGFTNFTTYWCNLNVLVCGVMANGAAIMRIYSASMRRIQRDPLDPHFREPFDPVLPSAESLGLVYLPDWHPAAGYVNWWIGNAQSTWAWAEMVGVTADRAATCLWLIQLPNNDCNYGIFNMQMDRLNWGISELAYLQAEAGGTITPWLRDYLGQGYAAEWTLFNDQAWAALRTAWALQ